MLSDDGVAPDQAVGDGIFTANFIAPRNAETFIFLSPAGTETVGVTSTALSSSPNPSTFGSPVTFTANVLPQTATGKVTFKDGTIALATISLSGGAATYTTSALSAVSHTISAVYSGDGNYNSSTSSPLTQTVNKATTTTTIKSSSNPSTHGASVTFTASVSSNTATGTVIFKDETTELKTVTTSGGVAIYTTSTLDVGAHTITAVYSRDGNYNGSTSSLLSGIKGIASGSYHTVALKGDGTVVAWGRNDYGQATTPAGLTGVTAIAAGGFHTMALKEDGTAVAWGDNTYGQATTPTVNLTQTVNKATTSATIKVSNK